MRATYRTNRYDLPLLEVIGVKPIGQNFHIAFGFLKDEKNDSFLWAIRRVKELFRENCDLDVVITNKEASLVNAVKAVFPSSTHLLCKRHIAKDVEKKV